MQLGVYLWIRTGIYDMIHIISNVHFYIAGTARYFVEFNPRMSRMDIRCVRGVYALLLYGEIRTGT